MRVAVLATGGKDSVLVLHHVTKEGYEVKCLASMIPQKEDSWMFHFPNIHLADMLAEAVEIPIVKAETSGIEGEEVEDLKHLIEKLDVEGVVSGAIASTYQKTRIEKICEQLGIACIAPLWQRHQQDILAEILSLRFEVIITGVYAFGFDEDWLGRKVDETTVADLVELNRKYGVSIVGEGGEYESMVLDAPLFKKKIGVVEAHRVWKGQSGHLRIMKARFESK